MSLPDCKIIAGEKKDSNGFCPVQFYVPKEYDDQEQTLVNGQFGMVCGCIWGDDSSWKIEYLDLSEITKGIIKREHRFGFFELADRDLDDAFLSIYPTKQGPEFYMRGLLYKNFPEEEKDKEEKT